MQRVIKYRAWADNRMVGWDNLNPAVLRGGDPSITVMQFTGLCDRHGTEIYEGDILDQGGLRLPITVEGFHGYRFMFGLDTLVRANAVYGEVVGNVYQNPELVQE